MQTLGFSASWNQERGTVSFGQGFNVTVSRSSLDAGYQEDGDTYRPHSHGQRGGRSSSTSAQKSRTGFTTSSAHATSSWISYSVKRRWPSIQILIS